MSTDPYQFIIAYGDDLDSLGDDAQFDAFADGDAPPHNVVLITQLGWHTDAERAASQAEAQQAVEILISDADRREFWHQDYNDLDEAA